MNILKFAFLILLLISLLSVLSWADSTKEKGDITLKKFRNENADIYFIPIGEVSDEFILDLAKYYKKILDVDVGVTPRIVLPADGYNQQRDQHSSTQLLDSIQEQFKGYSKTRKPTFLGITHVDLYQPSIENWRFVFGSRIIYDEGFREGSGDGVISSARIEFGSLPERNKLSKSPSNFRKMISRYIGEIHYKKERNDNPKSVLYRSILGLDDLDLMDENSIYTDILGLKNIPD